MVGVDEISSWGVGWPIFMGICMDMLVSGRDLFDSFETAVFGETWDYIITEVPENLDFQLFQLPVILKIYQILQFSQELLTRL